MCVCGSVSLQDKCLSFGAVENLGLFHLSVCARVCVCVLCRVCVCVCVLCRVCAHCVGCVCALCRVCVCVCVCARAARCVSQCAVCCVSVGCASLYLCVSVCVCARAHSAV